MTLLCFTLALACAVPVQGDSDIDRLIQALGDNSPETRAAADRDLRAKIKSALPALRKAAAEQTDLQIRSAAKELVASFSAGALLWKYECSHGGGHAQPIQPIGEAKGTLVVHCSCGTPLMGLDAATGKPRWESRVGERASTHFSMAGDLVFATLETPSGTLMALDPVTGAQVWTITGKGLLHRPTIVGDRVYVGGSDGVRVLDAATGELKWHYSTTEWVSTPTVWDEVVLASGHDRKVRALRRDSGKLLWEFLAGEHPSDATVSGDQVFVGSEGRFFALNLKSGTKQWELAVKGVGDRRPEAAGGRVYYTSRTPGPVLLGGGGTEQKYQHSCIDIATGTFVPQQRRVGHIPGRTHWWAGPQAELTAVDDDDNPLKDALACAVPGCDGVHRLTSVSLTVGEDRVNVYRANGRLRASLDARDGDRIIVSAGGFPVYPGRPYEGIRRSAVLCLRAADVD